MDDAADQVVAYAHPWVATIMLTFKVWEGGGRQRERRHRCPLARSSFSALPSLAPGRGTGSLPSWISHAGMDRLLRKHGVWVRQAWLPRPLPPRRFLNTPPIGATTRRALFQPCALLTPSHPRPGLRPRRLHRLRPVLQVLYHQLCGRRRPADGRLLDGEQEGGGGGGSTSPSSFFFFFCSHAPAPAFPD